ncbi:MAG: hypothetical protein LRY67_02570 [Gammaproteobacteria bacterium]|nr:hypothetical protein [Gammaproteobacteria bacterium]
MIKKKIFLSSLIFFIVTLLSIVWWYSVKEPLVKSTEIAKKQSLEDQKYMDSIKKTPSSSHEILEKDLMSPSHVSMALVIASPKQDFILNNLKKEKVSDWNGLFKNNYEINGISTYQQFISFLNALNKESGIFLSQ